MMQSQSQPITYSVLIGLVVTVGVLGVVFSPSNATQIFGFCSLVTVALVNMLQNQKAAEKVATQVADNTHAQVIARQVILDNQVRAEQIAVATHKLVNSGMAAQLRLLMLAYKRIAEREGDPGDVELYQQARQTYEAHMATQARIDADPDQAQAVSEGKTNSGEAHHGK